MRDNLRGPTEPRSFRSSATMLLVALLLASRLVFLVPNLWDLVVGGGSVDLHGRHVELNWVVHGIDPFDALELVRSARSEALALNSNREGSTSASSARAARLPAHLFVGDLRPEDSSRVEVHVVPYPQWSYPVLLPLMWPPWPFTRPYFAVILVAALSSLLLWAHRLLPRPWSWAAVFVVLLPMPSWGVSFFTGQLSAVVVLVMALFASSLARGRWRTAGLLLVVALVKPTLTVPFLWAVVVSRAPGASRGRVETMLLAGLGVVGATALVWWRVGTDPLSWMAKLVAINTVYAGEGYGLLRLVTAAGLPTRTGSLLFAIVGFMLAGILTWRFRHRSLLVIFALLAVVSRLWAYHRHYDDVILVFLLLALLVEVKRGSLLCLAALVSVALSLATPLPSSAIHEAWRVGIWMLSLVILLWEGEPVEDRVPGQPPRGIDLLTGDVAPSLYPSTER